MFSQNPLPLLVDASAIANALFESMKFETEFRKNLDKNLHYSVHKSKSGSGKTTKQEDIDNLLNKPPIRNELDFYTGDSANEHLKKNTTKAVQGPNQGDASKVKDIEQLYCMGHRDFALISATSVEHGTPHDHITQNVEKFLKYLNENPKIAGEFLTKEDADLDVKNFFRRDKKDNNKIKANKYLYKVLYNQPSNLWLLCQACNSVKSNKEVLDWFLKNNILGKASTFGNEYEKDIQKAGGLKKGIIFGVVQNLNSKIVKVAKAWELCLDSDLPSSKIPEDGKIYLQKQGKQLNYVAKDHHDNKINGIIDVDVEKLDKNFLENEKNKSTILEKLSNKNFPFGEFEVCIGGTGIGEYAHVWFFEKRKALYQSAGHFDTNVAKLMREANEEVLKHLNAGENDEAAKALRFNDKKTNAMSAIAKKDPNTFDRNDSGISSDDEESHQKSDALTQEVIDESYDTTEKKRYSLREVKRLILKKCSGYIDTNAIDLYFAEDSELFSKVAKNQIPSLIEVQGLYNKVDDRLKNTPLPSWQELKDFIGNNTLTAEERLTKKDQKILETQQREQAAEQEKLAIKERADRATQEAFEAQQQTEKERQEKEAYKREAEELRKLWAAARQGPVVLGNSTRQNSLHLQFNTAVQPLASSSSISSNSSSNNLSSSSSSSSSTQEQSQSTLSQFVTGSNAFSSNSSNSSLSSSSNSIAVPRNIENKALYQIIADILQNSHDTTPGKIDDFYSRINRKLRESGQQDIEFNIEKVVRNIVQDVINELPNYARDFQSLCKNKQGLLITQIIELKNNKYKEEKSTSFMPLSILPHIPTQSFPSSSSPSLSSSSLAESSSSSLSSSSCSLSSSSLMPQLEHVQAGYTDQSISHSSSSTSSLTPQRDMEPMQQEDTNKQSKQVSAPVKGKHKHNEGDDGEEQSESQNQTTDNDNTNEPKHKKQKQY